MIEDARLLAQAAAGEAGAFEVWVRRHRDSVWRFVRSLTRDPAEAEDALQEAFLAAWRGAGAFRGEGSALGWLLTLARHAVYRQHRLRAGEPPQLESLDSLETLGLAAGWGDGAGASTLDTLADRQEVARALATLTPAAREVLLLRDVEGLSLEACATALACTLPALKSRLHRARLQFAAGLRRGRHVHGS